MDAKTKAGVAVASAALLAFVGTWEGRSLPVYTDMAGYDTVCNGHTGPDVKKGDVWTKEQCDAILHKDVTKHGTGILACITVPINQNEYNAYTSLAFNTGIAAVCNSSIPKKLAAGKRTEACNTILDFDKIRDCNKPRVWNKDKQRWECPLVPVRGLTNRRKAEHALCLKPVSEAQKALA